jgi:predicted nucleotidyltransferase
VASGLVVERRLGQARLVRSNPEHVLARPLTELLELTYGPVVVLPQVLAGLEGVREAFVYGSWAARRLGEPGPAPRDLDVVVIGSPTRAQLAEASLEAGRRLHREVNITRITPAVWDAGQDAFVKTLTSRPLVRLDLGTDGHGEKPARDADDADAAVGRVVAAKAAASRRGKR